MYQRRIRRLTANASKRLAMRLELPLISCLVQRRVRLVIADSPLPCRLEQQVDNAAGERRTFHHRKWRLL
jgi:hypothetical protein